MQCKVYFFMFFNGEEKCKAPKEKSDSYANEREKMYANGFAGFT